MWMGAAPVTIRVVEFGGADPVPCRIHLQDASGEPVKAGEPFWQHKVEEANTE